MTEVVSPAFAKKPSGCDTETAASGNLLVRLWRGDAKYYQAVAAAGILLGPIGFPLMVLISVLDPFAPYHMLTAYGLTSFVMLLFLVSLIILRVNFRWAHATAAGVTVFVIFCYGISAVFTWYDLTRALLSGKDELPPVEYIAQHYDAFKSACSDARKAGAVVAASHNDNPRVFAISCAVLLMTGGRYEICAQQYDASGTVVPSGVEAARYRNIYIVECSKQLNEKMKNT